MRRVPLATRRGAIGRTVVIAALITLAGCGGGSSGPTVEEQNRQLRATLAEAQSSLVAWKVGAVLIGVLAVVIGLCSGSKARRDADRPAP